MRINLCFPRIHALIAAFLLLGLFLAAASTVRAADPSDLWSQEVPSKPLSAADGGQLPSELMPAFRFQILYVKMLSGAKSSEWQRELSSFAALPGSDPLSSGIRDAARIWLARAEMVEIDALLLEYYKKHIKFPATDADFQKLLPESLTKDPWGRPWVYEPGTPRGLSQTMIRQRYSLIPSGRTGFLPLRDALKNRQPLNLASKVTVHDIAGRRALEFRSPGAVSVIEPGGRAEGHLLMHVGNHWALMSGDDRLFPVIF
jgi:hypothetical protein